jgi:hypothetical protein
MTNNQKIIALNTIWYELIAGEYHKDRDCHFYIYSHYYYGDSVEYIVEHKGYIKHNYEDTIWNTYEEAETELIRLLKEIIVEEVNSYLEHYGEETYDQHARYDKKQLEDILKKVVEITTESQKHPMYPLHWMGLDPLIHEQAKDLTIEESIDKVKQKTPWVEEPVDWKGEKSLEKTASDLDLRVVKLENFIKMWDHHFHP